MKTVQYVYFLIDPRDQSIFYVGLAVEPHRRFRQWVRIGLRNENPRAPWSLAQLRVREIAEANNEVIMHIVETVESENWAGGYVAEKLWIVRLANSGIHLLNDYGIRTGRIKLLLDKCV